MIILIAAAGEHNELGKNNDLLWHLPDDFKRFKNLTTGHHIIMGRKTFESFPKPLPNRLHIIITRKKDYIAPEGCIVVNSLEEALEYSKNQEIVYIIGGGEIYNQAIEIADCIELTRVHSKFDADTFFPKINSEKWKKSEVNYHPEDEKHKYSFSFETYVRI